MIAKNLYDNILFFDIETVPVVYDYFELDEDGKKLFDTKNARYKTEDKSEEQVYIEKAGILAEFARVVCISVGFLTETRMGRQIRIASFAHHDEETLLKQFISLLEDHPKYYILCGHNSKEFDIPVLCRRMLINGLKLPKVLQIAGKKPWEIAHLDTMELWKFGDYKAYTSLALLCHVFKIPTPKDDISGADVARVFYEEDDLPRITRYCEKDVVALIQLFLKMNGEPLVDEGEIKIKV
jgi:predicted PolB exonuclease-like 3'-5' exonuclease